MTKDVSVFVKCDPRFLYCKLPQMRTSEFRKVVQQHTEGMVGSIVCGFCWKLSSLSVKEFWKSVKNRHRRTEPAGFCPTMSYGSRKRSYDQGGCVRRGVWPPSAAYNVEPVTNNSSSSCAKNGDGHRREYSARRLPTFAALFFTLRDSYGLQHCRPVCSDIRSESRFFATTPAFDAPIKGVPVGISPSRLAWKNWHGLATRYGEKISKISLFVLTQLTNHEFGVVLFGTQCTRNSAIAERQRDASCHWIVRWDTYAHSRSFEMAPLSTGRV